MKPHNRAGDVVCSTSTCFSVVLVLIVKMSSDSIPDYYAILEISPGASSEEIRTAYRKASLKCHPDRITGGPNLQQRKKKATEQFQAVADAYFILIDDNRRRNYDRLRASRPTSSSASSSASYFASFFGGNNASNNEDPAEEELREDGRPDPGHVFGNVFEEMLRPEVHSFAPVWTWTGAVAGAALGFIVGNVAGAAVGGFSGSRLGAVRDAKGKAVYQVFIDLTGEQRAEILRNLAFKVLGSAMNNMSV